MLELLNQLDGFQPSDNVKIIAATNRIDILDPALLRSGRLDRKIEFPKPDQEARARIMQIHARKMTVDPDVNFDEISRCCDDFNGAQCKGKASGFWISIIFVNSSYLRRSRYDRSQTWSCGNPPRRLYGSRSRSSGEEEGQSYILRIIRIHV